MTSVTRVRRGRDEESWAKWTGHPYDKYAVTYLGGVLLGVPS